MNKYLMMSAAALLGGATPGFAAGPSATHTIHFFNSNGGSYCDGMTFYKSPFPAVPIELGAHLLSGCGQTDTEVAGKGSKTQFAFAEGWVNSSNFLWNISKPIKNGGTWELWACGGDSSCFEVGYGIYKLGYQAGKGNRMSTTAKVAEMIAERKAARR